MALKKIIVLMLCAAWPGALLAAPATLADQTLVEGAKLCTRLFPQHERQHGIPTHLLAAIATTESGRWHNGLKMSLPWPWTVNAEGKGFYLSSKQEAIHKVNSLRAQGIKSIDVGCMQVNLMHHPDAFANITQAFDPQYNVAYAAKFLKSNYDESGSWKKAAADYHSRTPSRGNPYVGIVYNAWQKIAEKVKQARGAIQESGKRYVRTGPTEWKASTATAKFDFNDEGKSLTASVGPKRTAYQPPRMRVIEVSSRKQQPGVEVLTVEKGVNIVRPANAAEAEKRAEEKTVAAAAPALAPEMPKVRYIADEEIQPAAGPMVVKVGASESSPAASKKTGPRFIFN